MTKHRAIPATITTNATTFERFEREVSGATPTTGILDAISLGVWSIAEQAGLLAGAWRRHRNLMQDLDVPVATAILGELLVAVAQTALALGVPLDDVAQQQVKRLQTPSSVGRSATRNARLQKLAAPVRGAPLTSSGIWAASALPFAPGPVPDPTPPGRRRTPAAARPATSVETPRAPAVAPATPAATPAIGAGGTATRGLADAAARRSGRPRAAVQELVQEPERAAALSKTRRSVCRETSAPATVSPVPAAVPLTTTTAATTRHAPMSKAQRSQPVSSVSEAATASPGGARAPRGRSTSASLAPPVIAVGRAPSAPVRQTLVEGGERPPVPRRRRASAADPAPS